MGKIVLAVLAVIGLLAVAFVASLFGGTLIWLLWNSVIVAEFAVLPKLTWLFCVAATWIARIILPSVTHSK
jgi:hypothetical protein